MMSHIITFIVHYFLKPCATITSYILQIYWSFTSRYSELQSLRLDLQAYIFSFERTYFKISESLLLQSKFVDFQGL